MTRNSCRHKSIDVWKKGVDTEVFHPKHRNEEMRARMSGGHPEAPLLLYVGRLGAGVCVCVCVCVCVTVCVRARAHGAHMVCFFHLAWRLGQHPHSLRLDFVPFLSDVPTTHTLAHLHPRPLLTNS